MSGTICHLPGAFGVPDWTLEASSHAERAETGDQDRVRRVIELYRRLQAVPRGTLDEEGAASVVRAITEGRENDALALLDIALEEPDSDFEPVDEIEDPYGTPIPHAAMIWRYVPAPTKPRLSVVGKESTAARAQAKRLVAARVMKMEEDWFVGVGGIDMDAGGNCAAIELGMKGELFILLRAGELAIEDAAGACVMQVESTSAVRLVRIVYCAARSRTSAASLTLRLVAQGDIAPQGIWYHSSRKEIDEASRASDPEAQDTFFCGHYIPISDRSDRAFCEGAEAIAGKRGYKHLEAEKRGDFVRFSLGDHSLSSFDGWCLDSKTLSTRAIGITAAPAMPDADLHRVERELIVHDGRIELMTVLDGMAWVAIAAEKAGGADDEREELFLASPHDADGKHRATLVTPLFGSPDGCDVMLLCPAYGHSVWMTPGTESRVLHLCFADPLLIVPKREKGRDKARDKVPLARPARRLAGGH